MNANDIAKVAVIGAGTMGAGIAGEFARAGCDVRLVDLDDSVLERGLDMLRAAQQGLTEAGALSGADADAAMVRVEATTDLSAACDQVDLLIEAVSENMDVKQKMFRELDALCPSGAVLASNTSGLSITEIATSTGRPELVGGMHFWNPPHIIPLVEVTKGEATSQATADFLMDVCRRLGKSPILVQHDVPGFVGNRLQMAVLREAIHILSEGIASAEDIDTAMSKGPGLRYGLMGPLRSVDLGGLDIFHAISSYLAPELCSDASSTEFLKGMVAKGDLGAKTGHGFYTYSPEDRDRIIARRDRALMGFLKVIGMQASTEE